jgi:uncharacterized protein
MHPNEALLRQEYESRPGHDEGLSEVLSEDVVWRVLGTSAISGVYRGRDEVLEYVRRRRELADDTFEIKVEEVLANDQHGLVIASGRARLGGQDYEWRAHGLYRFAGGRSLSAECCRRIRRCSTAFGADADLSLSAGSDIRWSPLVGSSWTTSTHP